VRDRALGEPGGRKTTKISVALRSGFLQERGGRNSGSE
jgi:hypothetical protein